MTHKTASATLWNGMPSANDLYGIISVPFLPKHRPRDFEWISSAPTWMIFAKGKYLEVEENIFMILLLGRPCSRVCLRFGNSQLKGSTHIIISHYTITTKNALIVCWTKSCSTQWHQSNSFHSQKNCLEPWEGEMVSALCLHWNAMGSSEESRLLQKFLQIFLGWSGLWWNSLKIRKFSVTTGSKAEAVHARHPNAIDLVWLPVIASADQFYSASQFQRKDFLFLLFLWILLDCLFGASKRCTCVWTQSGFLIPSSRFSSRLFTVSSTASHLE